MANATDIITYVGIPLAVLGVLPILYTFAIAIINLRRVRRALVHHGHRPITSTKKQDGFTLRSSPMTTLIEVELPKFAIAPLERSHEDYWQLTQKTQSHGREIDHLLERADSTLSSIEEGKVQGYLRGGSWRAFHWKKLIVGKKLYRIQYEDELREPPAEIDFTDLVNFLLDWGAQLDGMGWEKLRSAGLWTPAGTVLLKLPHEDETKHYQHDWILRTVMPDESDGVLTVCMQWPSIFSEIGSSRGAHSLPPGWGRLSQPKLDESGLATRIDQLRQSHKHATKSTSMRLKTEAGLISEVFWEHGKVETKLHSSLGHLSRLPLSQSWFTIAASSLLDGSIWGVETPTEISTFARKDTMPVGVMVLLRLLPEDKAPQWTTSTSVPSHVNAADQHRRRFEAKLAAERLEATMSPQQAQVARMNREKNERQERIDDMMEMQRLRTELDRKRFTDAIASVRFGNKAVSETCRDYLAEAGDIGKDWTVRDVAEAVLYLLVLDESEEESSLGFKVLKVLDDWMTWTNAGGMLREHFSWLEENKIAFCYAACLVAVVQEGFLSSRGKGKASVDMLECLRMWRKVRLG